MIDTFRIPVMGYYLYYSWVNEAFRLALVQEIPKHEYNDLFNSGEMNQEAFKSLGMNYRILRLRIPVRIFANLVKARKL